ncbi:hypothetical protein BC826DRAFT_966879 [Russula brevipes]|nr:hypothetical protein BC826DRAFT_966879 [Russula brevipes]
MSQNSPQTRSSSNYDIIFDNALKAYKKKTGKDLTSDPLLHRLETCSSPDSVLDALREQLPNFDQSGTRNDRFMNWLNPTVNVLYGFSTTIGGAAGSIYPLAGIVFTGIGTLLSTVQAVGASRGSMIDLFERIETYFRRLETYVELPRAIGMMDIIVEVMVEVLIVLALATRENKQGRIKRFLKKLIGKSDIRDALGRLDKLMQTKRCGIRNDVQGVGGQLDAVIDGGQRLSRELRQVANDVDSQKRLCFHSTAFSVPEARWCLGKQLRQDLQNWLSPPDPTINFNAASDAHHEGTTSCRISTAGSGKSVLTSAIVRDIRDSRSGLVTIFFFDFKDTGKQDIRALLSSLIVQLSYESDSFYDILLDFYSAPVMNILKVPGEAPIYLIVDALDECPGTSGITSPREKVLELVKVLPLTSNRISLHDESGQKEAISNYVRYVVKMQRWKKEDKKLVIETLLERADGMFRWVFCQLEALRHSLPSSVRHILAKLPKSLDETYERILQEIPKVNQVHTHRLLQCLTVAVRPLTVEELAEVFAIDFPVAGGIPKLDESSRCEDQEHAVLSACSSLIAIVEHKGSRRVHFSHFSVKEFLISDRLAGKTVDASHYHIRLYSACTTMAQVCLAALLRFDDQMDEKTIKSYPLAEYAGQHFTDHADSEVVLKELNDDGLDRLFDPDKPHFDIWWRLRNGDQAGDNPYDAQLSVQEPEPEPEPVSPVSIAVEQGLTAVAQYDYEAAEGDELSLVGGELIVGIIQEATDWWSGSSADGTRAGLFPATYVTLVDMLPELEPVDEGVVAVASYECGMCSSLDSDSAS